MSCRVRSIDDPGKTNITTFFGLTDEDMQLEEDVRARMMRETEEEAAAEAVETEVVVLEETVTEVEAVMPETAEEYLDLKAEQ